MKNGYRIEFHLSSPVVLRGYLDAVLLATQAGFPYEEPAFVLPIMLSKEEIRNVRGDPS